MNIAYIGFDNECTTKICNYLTGSHSITLFTNRTPTYELDCDVVIDKSFWAGAFLFLIRLFLRITHCGV